MKAFGEVTAQSSDWKESAGVRRFNARGTDGALVRTDLRETAGGEQGEQAFASTH